MIRIIDTYPDIVQSFSGTSFQMEQWKEYAGQISPAPPQKCLDDILPYDFNRQVLPVLEYALSHPEQMETAHTSFCHAAKDLNQTIQDIFQTSVNADIIFYLGLCNGAGWATSLGGRPVVLLGAEKILELNWQDQNNMYALIYHELGHLCHFQHRTAARFEHSASALWQLYTEGMAMFFEQELIGNPEFFHQDHAGWLDWCRRNESGLFAEYLRRYQSRESIQDFFGDWCSYQGRSDVGYFLGSAVIRNLSRSMSYQQLCDCGLNEIETEMRRLSGT